MKLINVISTTIREYLNESHSNNIWYHGSNSKFNMFDLVDNKTYMEFDSILIAEELEKDVESIGIFDKENIKIV